MRLRNVPEAMGILEASSFTVKQPEINKGKWKDYFGNDNPIYVEIGMGKGKFLTTLAAQNPNVNYIGIEKMASVLYKAALKLDSAEEKLSNIALIMYDADKLEEIFSAEEIDRIYLNFSDPWPKKRHSERRLTSGRFLSKYAEFLKKEGSVEFKTDNTDLFDYSVESVKEHGWELLLVEYDLHHSPYCEGNVMTEYEEKFSAAGNNIHKMVFRQMNAGESSR